MRRYRTLLGLALVTALAALLRCLGIADVFPGDDEVFLRIADSSYHARRALYGYVNFPSVLVFDPYLAYPDGAPVPIPPLFDFLLSSVARGFASDARGFERAIAWVSPVLGALTVLPVYAVGRAIGGATTGFGAALLYAVLPVAASASGVGDADHHAAVSLLAAVLLALIVAVTRSGISVRSVALASCGLLLVRAALLLTWSGSLLYLAIGDGVLLLAGSLAGRPALLRGQALGAWGAAALVAPWVARAGVPIGGPLSATNLSWLHVVALCALGLIAALLAEFEQRRPEPRPVLRVARAGAVTAVIAAGLGLVLPAVGTALSPGAAFLAKSDAMSAHNIEQWPLYPFLGGSRPGSAGTAVLLYGLFAWLVPVAPLVVLWRARDARVRLPALCLAIWTTVLAILAVSQVRFGNEFAASAAVAFALLLVGAGRLLARRMPTPLASAVVVLTGCALLWPGVSPTHGARLASARAWLAGSPHTPAPSLRGAQSLVRFARMVRAATPETAGFFDARAKPEYGVLVNPAHGHVIQYAARRPTPASNFGPHLDAEKYEASLAFFFATRSEREALARSRALGVRYVMSFDHERLAPGSFHFRLHREDGSVRPDAPHVERFRLVTEGPPGGLPLWTSFPSAAPPRRTIPYKLFEIVEGAVLEVSAAPGDVVRAALELATPIGRRLRFVAAARADGDSIARLRVPYPTGPTGSAAPVRATGPYQVVVGGVSQAIPVTEEDVRSGAVIRVGAGATDRGDPPGAGRGG